MFTAFVILLCCCLTMILKRSKRDAARMTAARNLEAAERERLRLERTPVDAEILANEKPALKAKTPAKYGKVKSGTPAKQRPSETNDVADEIGEFVEEAYAMAF